MSSLAIGLDVGTQSVKLLAYDPASRQVLAIHSQPLELSAGEDGSREQQADWWIAAIRACFARLDAPLSNADAVQPSLDAAMNEIARHLKGACHLSSAGST